MLHRLVSALTGIFLLAMPSQSQVVEIDHVALRDRSLSVLENQFGEFRVAAAGMADASRDYCAKVIDRAAYDEVFRATWLAWAPLDAYQFGPIVQRGAVLSVGFWPDKKDYVGRGLKQLLSESAEALADPETIARHSAAVQGLPAIERLLFDEMPSCPAIVGISAHVAMTADALYADWFDAGGWADLARGAGPENPVYLSDAEFTKVLFTAIDFELTRIADTRLSRPLGTFDAPRPSQAEAWQAGLSLAIIDAQLAGIAELLKLGFAEAVDQAGRLEVLNAIKKARARIGDIGAPLDKAVAKPMTRIRVEGLQSEMRSLHVQLAEIVGPSLGVETGFSAADGD